MSEDISYWDDEDQNEDDTQQAPANDNRAIKALREKAKADGVKISELNTKLEALSNSERERTVKELLEKKGVNPKVARLALKELGEITDEGVDAWLKENADSLNLKVVPTPGEENTETFGELSNQDALTSQAVSPGTGNRFEDKLATFKTFEELNDYVKSQQK